MWVDGLLICSLGCFSGFFTGFFFCWMLVSILLLSGRPEAGLMMVVA